MEFIGKRVQGKELAAVCIAAFFAGRINLFDGTFPAAPAFVIVMLAVSTVYIYLLPFVLGGMLCYMRQGVFLYGDMAAVTCLAVFFLFFHQKKLSINQRTAIGVAVLILCNLAAFLCVDMLFLMKPEVLLMEAMAFCIYVRVFNTIAKILYTGKPHCGISRERISVSLEIMAVSFIGAIGIYEVVFSLWLFLIAAMLYNKGLKEAFSLAGVTAVCSFCLVESQWQIYGWLLVGMMTAWYLASWVDKTYRKIVIGTVLLISLSGTGGGFVYGFAAAMALFIWMPAGTFSKAGYMIENRFLPEALTERDLQHLAIRRDLQKKKEAFLSLSRLCGTELEGKQILSYQFTGMARTIDRLQEDLQGRTALRTEGGRLVKVSVGQASYSAETVSGDSMAAFSFDDHKIALVISDGMGKGREAAEESKMVVSTLMRLLQAGFDVDLAMKTVNGILMASGGEERFATVDLAIIDRAKCRAKIYKMGAATTFIKHDGRVSMLKRQALPAGITAGLDLEYIDIKLKRGDLLVMVSDGVTECDRKDFRCDWLRSRLLEFGSRDPETIAELVINKAAEKYGIHERDDLTVLTAAIDV
ncbi:MAG: SpoIIE family protein phosphatase [Firmicutes bacterium]|nr:SpoIIE family protein phosphatase [Bacillota bacterium]